MTMPGDIVFDSNTTYFGQNLTDYVNNGTIAEERVTVRLLLLLLPQFIPTQQEFCADCHIENKSGHGYSNSGSMVPHRPR